MPPKRKIEGPIEAAFSKKPRTKETIPEAELTEAELSDLSHAELVQTAITLQKALTAATAAAQQAPSSQTASTWTPERITEKAKTVRALANKEITKQMKWQPSCKTGGTRWSYKGMVPCREVFDEIFGNEKGAKKQWKMKKFDARAFQNIFGHIEASCRYNDLRITSENINVKWEPEELTFQMSGTYGI